MSKIWNRIKCWWYGCDFELIEVFNDHAGRFKCKCCHLDLAYTKHEGGMCIPYTVEVKEFYARLNAQRTK